MSPVLVTDDPFWRSNCITASRAELSGKYTQNISSFQGLHKRQLHMAKDVYLRMLLLTPHFFLAVQIRMID